jgi:hypothetical protein
MVDEAKAFCPGCGHAFVEEEKRQKKSEFERQENTVQLGQTMYNQMLSDMGLNLAKATPASEKRIEVIAPVGEPVGKPASSTTDISPKPSPEIAPVLVDKPKTRGRAKWIVLGIIGIVLLLPPALVSTVLLVLQIVSRYK